MSSSASSPSGRCSAGGCGRRALHGRCRHAGWDCCQRRYCREGWSRLCGVLLRVCLRLFLFRRQFLSRRLGRGFGHGSCLCREDGDGRTLRYGLCRSGQGGLLFLKGERWFLRRAPPRPCGHQAVKERNEQPRACDQSTEPPVVRLRQRRSIVDQPDHEGNADEDGENECRKPYLRKHRRPPSPRASPSPMRYCASIPRGARRQEVSTTVRSEIRSIHI